MKLTIPEKVQILIEVVRDIPRFQSEVARSPEADAYRRALVREVREMKEKGVMPDIPDL